MVREVLLLMGTFSFWTVPVLRCCSGFKDRSWVKRTINININKIYILYIFKIILFYKYKIIFILLLNLYKYKIILK